MFFATDNQTLEDLNIYGKPGTDSVYALYNRTVTINGAAILEEMFRQPLSSGDAINERSRLIRYMLTMQVSFPFQAELFDRAEQYLDNTDERTRISAEKQSLEKQFTRLIAANTDEQVIYNGITALIEMIQQVKVFIDALCSVKESPYQTHQETQEMISLLTGDFMASLLNENAKSKIPHQQLAALDNGMRFRHRAQMKELLQYLYHLDVYIAIAKTAAEKHFVFPDANDKGGAMITVEGFYHPHVKNAVPNTIEIGPDGSVVFLTGANMAGKSTFMKSLGIAVYLAHMGFPVAAKHMEFAVLNGMYTTINLADNLSLGASHFYAEVLRLKMIAKELKLGKKLFVIFDELFRGTNVKDAFEATVAITAAFARRQDSVFVISTHIIEAGTELKRRSGNISYKYLPTLMNENTPQYTYTLQTGITADRHGMLIINNERILDILKKEPLS